MRIVVTGATGSIGRRLVPALLARGDRVAVVTRRPREARRLFGGEVEIVAADCSVPGQWQLCVDGARAIVHLAGASVADGRWTRARRDLIETSRVEGTYHVVTAIEDARERPAALVCASGTAFYGDMGDEEIHERFPAGKGFLADVCVRWEAEARKAERFGVRVVLARIGVVLDEHGPALRRMLPWFRVALGATVGSGRQWMPWIWHGDCTAALIRCIDRATLKGPVNVTAPEPCTQREFAKALGRAVGRPALLRVPGPALRAGLGGLAEELLQSKRVVPRQLLDDGFRFEAPSIGSCMDALLREEADGRSGAGSAPPATAGIPAPTIARPARPPARPRLLVVSQEVIDVGPAPRLGTQESLRAVANRGCAVVVASSARGPAMAHMLGDPLLHPIAIAANGAVLWSHREGRAVHSERLDQSTLAALTLALRGAVPGVDLVFEGEDWLAGARDEIEGFGGVDLRLRSGELPPKPTVRLHAIAPPAALASAREAVTHFWRERKVTLFGHGAGGALTIAAPLVDRAVAAQRIARRIGATREETMAIVANDDDIGLADWCGFAVAVADAPGAVRRLVAAALPSARGAGPESEPLAVAVRKYFAE